MKLNWFDVIFMAMPVASGLYLMAASMKLGDTYTAGLTLLGLMLTGAFLWIITRD